MSDITRIQGTDGIRGPVAPAAEFDLPPLETFLEYNILTEEFYEFYCYCHVKDLIDRGLMQKGEDVIVGWDSRDVEGFYTARGIAGISKAGGRPVTVGVLPTPGVAFALFRSHAQAAFMFTASHNPADQNGIKIFTAPDGMKMLPEDDETLTAKLFATPWEEAKDAPEGLPAVDESDRVMGDFVSFHLDPINAWVTAEEGPFANFLLALDTAHGATATIAPEVFTGLGIVQVEQVAEEQNGDINKNSGVAMLEGVRTFTRQDASSGSGLSAHQLVKKMFALADAKADDINKGLRLAGVVFDGDGDRFFLLMYEPENEAVHVLSGDECAALQGRYLMETAGERYKGRRFVHSVESDINVARYAASLGYEPVITAVGDKWVLKEAVDAPDEFGLGCEETGHSIHGGYAAHRGGTEKLFFAGNGLKGAINTLAVVAHLDAVLDEAAFWETVTEPFEPGFKKTAYSYYVNKSLFANDSDVWVGVKAEIERSFQNGVKEDYYLQESPMATEPDMLYLTIREEEDDSLAGSIFVRNSGTEDKTGVNLRCPAHLADPLSAVAEDAVLYLMEAMKDLDNPMASAEAHILENLSNDKQPVAEDYPTINYDRLLSEMEVKQKLVTRTADGLALTELGRWFLGKNA